MRPVSASSRASPAAPQPMTPNAGPSVGAGAQRLLSMEVGLAMDAVNALNAFGEKLANRMSALEQRQLTEAETRNDCVQAIQRECENVRVRVAAAATETFEASQVATTTMLDTWLRGATEEIAGLVLNEIRRDLRDEVVKLTKGCLSRWDESQIEFKAKLDERWEERHIGMRAIVHEELDHVIGKQETHEARVIELQESFHRLNREIAQHALAMQVKSGVTDSELPDLISGAPSRVRKTDFQQMQDRLDDLSQSMEDQKNYVKDSLDSQSFAARMTVMEAELQELRKTAMENSKGQTSVDVADFVVSQRNLLEDVQSLTRRLDREMDGLHSTMNRMEKDCFSEVDSIQKHVASLELSIQRNMKRLDEIDGRSEMNDLRMRGIQKALFDGNTRNSGTNGNAVAAVDQALLPSNGLSKRSAAKIASGEHAYEPPDRGASPTKAALRKASAMLKAANGFGSGGGGSRRGSDSDASKKKELPPHIQEVEDASNVRAAARDNRIAAKKASNEKNAIAPLGTTASNNHVANLTPHLAKWAGGLRDEAAKPPAAVPRTTPPPLPTSSGSVKAPPKAATVPPVAPGTAEAIRPSKPSTVPDPPPIQPPLVMKASPPISRTTIAHRTKESEAKAQRANIAAKAAQRKAELAAERGTGPHVGVQEPGAYEAAEAALQGIAGQGGSWDNDNDDELYIVGSDQS